MVYDIKTDIKNPFVIFGYDSPEYFCDREVETKKLTNAATNGRNVVLASIRRLGKSVLVKHVQNIMQSKNEIVPVYIDIMPTTDLASFTRVFAKSVFEQSATLTMKSFAAIKSLLTRITPSLTIDSNTNLPSIELKISDDDEALSTIDDVFRYIKSVKKHFYICIDEFQQISEYPEKNVEAVLRSHIQSIANANFVFSGSKKHLLMSMFSDAGRPFYQSSEFFELQKINDKKYIEFIIKQFRTGKQTIAEKEAKLILSKARTHTYYVQFLCNRLFEQRLKTIKQKDIETTLNNIINGNESVYHSYRSLLTNNQWQLLRAIAGEDAIKEPTSGEFIRKYHLSSTSTVSQALKSLLDKELIHTEKGSYFVTDVFFSAWLKKL
jgi:DNA-binding MarR family transcriptional regulator